MLITTNSNLTNKVGVFKLVSGEEVIARVVEDNSAQGSIRIKAPLSMIMVNDDGNQGMVAFAPWVLGAADDAILEIKTANLVVTTEARADAAIQYSQAVGEPAEATAKVTPTQSFGGRRGGRGR